MLRTYLRLFKKDFTEISQIGIFNCLQIIDKARSGNLSDEDFSDLDLRMCSLVGRNLMGTNFSESYVTSRLFLAKYHDEVVSDLNISPNGKYVISNAAGVFSDNHGYDRWLNFDLFNEGYAPSDNEAVKVWEVFSGKLVSTLYGHKLHIGVSAFCPQGKCIAIASESSIEVWEITSGTLKYSLDVHNERAEKIEISYDGNLILAVAKGVLYLWDLQTGSFIMKSNKKSCEARSAIFSRDGKNLIIGSGSSGVPRDIMIVVWDIIENVLTKVINLQVETTWRGVDFLHESIDGIYLMVRTINKVFRVDLVNGEVVYTFNSDSSQNSVKKDISSPDSRYKIKFKDKRNIYLHDNESGVLLKTFRGHVGVIRNVRCSHDNKLLFSASWDNSIKIWDVASGECVRTIKGNSDKIECIHCCPEGNEVVTTSSNGDIKIWDIGEGVLVRVFEEHVDFATSAKFCPSGKFVVSSSLDETIKIWNRHTGMLLQNIHGHSEGVNCVSFSFDGKSIVSSSFDKTIKVWDWDGKTVQPRLILSELEHWAENVDFSPCGNYIVSASHDNNVYVWNSKTGLLIHNLSGHKKYCKCAIYSPDGKFIASSSKDKSIKIWDSETGNLITTLYGHTYMVKSVSYSPDGTRIVSASEDKSIKIWNIEGVNLMQNIGEHTDWANSAHFIPGSDFVVSASNDGTIKVLEINTTVTVKAIYSVNTKLLNANLNRIKHDDMTSYDILVLKQNGAIVKGVTPSC